MTAERNRTAKWWSWVLVYFLIPFVPFLLEGLIRFVISGYVLRWDTFSGANLAMSCGLLLILLQVSLINYTPPLDNPDKADERMVACLWLILLAIFFFVLFGTMAVLDARASFLTDSDAQLHVSILDVVSASGFFLAVRYTMHVRSSFNLKVVL